METYNSSQPIIAASLVELKAIAEWAAAREPSHPGQSIVLIGGWAVHAYNNYFGSIDIDLYTNSKTKAALMHYLKTQRSFKPNGSAEISSSVSKRTGVGEIIIDFLSDDSDIAFKGRKEIFGFGDLRDHSIIRPVAGDLRMKIPERTLLLIFKLKASWDRTWAIDHGEVRNAGYLKGKIVKDGSDILALVDENYGGSEIDFNYLGSRLRNLGFLKEQLRRIPDSRESLEKYGRMDARTAKATCEKILSLI